MPPAPKGGGIKKRPALGSRLVGQKNKYILGFTRGVHLMIASSNGNIFHVTGALWGESTGHKDQWRGPLMFSLICICTNGWTNNRDASGLRRHRAQHDVNVMVLICRWDHYGHGLSHSKNNKPVRALRKILYISNTCQIRFKLKIDYTK